MEEHKLLTGMLLAALVISVGGTFIAMDSLGGITGAATGTGTGSATVSADISIDITDSSVDLGPGTVDSGFPYARIYSTADNDTQGGSWSNGTDDNITVVNIGNTKINLTVSSTNSSGNGSRGFACQGQTCATTFGNSKGVRLALWFQEAESNSCVGPGFDVPSVGRTKREFISADLEFTICECMDYQETANELAAWMEVGIPADAPSGSPSTTFTFTSYEPDSGYCN